LKYRSNYAKSVER